MLLRGKLNPPRIWLENRPLRIGWLVERNIEQLATAASWTSCLWGGLYNPVLPIIILLLLAAMVATFGFWATLKGILGAIGVIILLCLLGVLFLSFLAAWILKR